MPETLYLSPTAKLPYCRGCGHSLVVRELSHALEQLELPPRSPPAPSSRQEACPPHRVFHQLISPTDH